VADPDAALALTEGTHGFALGDRLFWRPRVRAELAQDGALLLAPFAHATRDPWPALSRRLSRLRYRIDTVFGQLTERGAIKRVWTQDL
jgi:hypothetical protein